MPAPSTPRRDYPAMSSVLESARLQGSDGPSYLQRILSVTDADILEKGVENGLKILGRVSDNFNHAAPKDEHASDAFPKPSDWLNNIENLRSGAKATSIVIGVVGSTGAGKSSVINAVLEEEKLLPTSCLRACTASPTEVSYNYSNDPNKLYRAEIEFISRDEWIKELNVLYGDFHDGDGNTSQGSDSGVAFAKIKAVYPNLNKQDIRLSNAEDLADRDSVGAVLGTVLDLHTTSARELYDKIQGYIDSKEKDVKSTMEFWPLIKAVRIYTKCAALSTGARLVDLPGVHDSNAARAAVATNYLKICNALWIVAPITRAVDDKSAKTLLGDSFKRQLKFDGTYCAVTFICSKTDDISVDEATESLRLTDRISEYRQQIEGISERTEDLHSEVRAFQKKKRAEEEQIEAIDADINEWQQLKDDTQDGRVVYAPDTQSIKKSRTVSSASSDRDILELSSDDDLPPVNQLTQKKSLTKDEIQERLKSFRSNKRLVRDTVREIKEKISNLRDEISTSLRVKKQIAAQIRRLCIQSRNNYSKSAIQRDFAEGLRELDQELTAEGDESEAELSQVTHDYEKIGQSLHVFCVSSRVYQKLRGRMKQDSSAVGFETEDDTGVPQLQEHARNATKEARVADCQRFLNDLSQLINSLKLWADDTGPDIDEKQKNAEKQLFESQRSGLEKTLNDEVRSAVNDLHEQLGAQIFDKLRCHLHDARNAAVPTALTWGASYDEGGLRWGTLRATCRRDGVFQSSGRGKVDFNAALSEPVMKQLVSPWEQLFQHRVPRELRQLCTDFQAALDDFHGTAVARARDRGTKSATLALLDSQLLLHKQSVHNQLRKVRKNVQLEQRDANRIFTETIGREMQTAYNLVLHETGPGSLKRMRAVMLEQVERNRHHMFLHAADALRTKLNNMKMSTKNSLLAYVKLIVAQSTQDYGAVLIGSIGAQREAERERRARLIEILVEADGTFKNILAPPEKSAVEKDAHSTTDSPTSGLVDRLKTMFPRSVEAASPQTNTSNLPLRDSTTPSANGSLGDRDFSSDDDSKSDHRTFDKEMGVKAEPEEL